MAIEVRIRDWSSDVCSSDLNYRASTRGGMISDVFLRWRYLIGGVLGPIASLAATSWTATPVRLDESGQPYRVDVDDTAHCLQTVSAPGRERVCQYVYISVVAVQLPKKNTTH